MHRSTLIAAALVGCCLITAPGPSAASAQSPVTISESVAGVPFWSQPEKELTKSVDKALYLKLSPQGCLAGSVATLRLTANGLPATETQSGPACNFGDQRLRFRGKWTIGVSASNPLDRNDFDDLCAADDCSIVSVELDGEPKRTAKSTLKWVLSVDGSPVSSGSALFTRSVKNRGSKKSYATTVKLR